MANNVDVTYTYKINNEDAYFDITLANIQSDMYFIDNYTGRTYYYNDTNNGTITLNDYPSGTVGVGLTLTVSPSTYSVESVGAVMPSGTEPLYSYVTL